MAFGKAAKQAMNMKSTKPFNQQVEDLQDDVRYLVKHNDSYAFGGVAMLGRDLKQLNEKHK